MKVTLAELAERFGSTAFGDSATAVDHVASLGDADPSALTFLANPHFRSALETTRAGIVVLADDLRDTCKVPCLVSANPHALFARIAAVLHPAASVVAGVAASACVADDVELAPSAQVAAGAVIGRGSVIGNSVLVGPGCVVGENVVVGDGTRLVAHVTLLDRVRVGARCLVQPGAVLGADGFGFARDGETWVKVPQIGTVIVGDDVEIGANATIDRGAIDDTVIEDGVKLDNLVHVAHNVHIGAHTAIAGTAAIAGSTRIGRRCMIAGGVGILGQLEICDDVVVLARSLVTRSIATAGVYSSGVPAEPANQWRRNVSRFKRLDEFVRRLGALERR